MRIPHRSGAQAILLVGRRQSELIAIGDSDGSQGPHVSRRAVFAGDAISSGDLSLPSSGWETGWAWGDKAMEPRCPPELSGRIGARPASPKVAEGKGHPPGAVCVWHTGLNTKPGAKIHPHILLPTLALFLTSPCTSASLRLSVVLRRAVFGGSARSFPMRFDGTSWPADELPFRMRIVARGGCWHLSSFLGRCSLPKRPLAHVLIGGKPDEHCRVSNGSLDRVAMGSSIQTSSV